MEKSPALVLACALRQEADGLRSRLVGIPEIVVTGLGTDRTMRSLEQLLESRKPGLVLFTGMAGQLDPSLQVGDFVFPSCWALESGLRFDVNPEWLDHLQARGWNPSGLGLTVRRPVVKEKSRLKLFRETGARICDMESAAAMMVCRSFGVPCLAAKVVSDTAASGMLSFFRNFDRNVVSLAENLKRLVPDLESI